MAVISCNEPKVGVVLNKHDGWNQAEYFQTLGHFLNFVWVQVPSLIGNLEFLWWDFCGLHWKYAKYPIWV